MSLGCGFRGGPIFPAVFLGVGLASLPVVWFDASPTLAVAVGAAAGMAAQTRLLFAPLLFATLLVGQDALVAEEMRASAIDTVKHRVPLREKRRDPLRAFHAIVVAEHPHRTPEDLTMAALDSRARTTPTGQ